MNLKRMKRHTENPGAPIWLVGDSDPKNWSKDLSEPLDSRHPARHNIWSPILLGLNSRLYSRRGRILNEQNIYVRNAVGRVENKPMPSAITWDKDARRSLSWFRRTLTSHKPLLVFTFGSFAFEFLLRAIGNEGPRPFRHWTTIELGNSFREAIRRFDLNGTNLLPLLHTSIARRHFLKAHENYTGSPDGNYFTYVADQLADKLAEIPDDCGIWAPCTKLSCFQSDQINQ